MSASVHRLETGYQPKTNESSSEFDEVLAEIHKKAVELMPYLQRHIQFQTEISNLVIDMTNLRMR